MKLKMMFAAFALVLLVAPAGALGPADRAIDWSQLVGCDGTLPTELVATEPANPALTVVVHATCAAPADDVLPATDCTRPTYLYNGYFFQTPVTFTVDTANGEGIGASAFLTAANAAGETWDAATLGEIFGSAVAGGKARNAGRYDGVNQVGFKNLQAGTVGLTTTWYYTATGIAVESDGAYNTAYGWTIGGSSTTFDLQNVMTHENGHTWSLGDLYDAADSCLTMYGYVDYGWTHQRTLGDGDIAGLLSVYG